MVRATSSDINALFSSHLISLLGGYLSSSGEKKSSISDMIDKSEEAMLQKNGVASPSGAGRDALSSW